MAGLGAFEAAAAAASRVGAVTPEDVERLIDDVVDALVIRGAPWLEPAIPDLDPRSLYDLASVGDRPTLGRVVAIGARLGDVVATSVELWSDRTVVRTRFVDGSMSDDLAAEPATGDRSFEVRGPSGETVGVDLRHGVASDDVAGSVSVRVAEADDDLDALVAVEIAALAESDPDAAAAGRTRIIAAAEVLGGDAHLASDRFDQAWGAPRSSHRRGGSLIEVIPLTVRMSDGWLASIESWSDRALLRWTPDRRPGRPSLWVLSGPDGALVGGRDAGDGVVVFEGRVPASAVLRRHTGGRVEEVGVRA